MEGTKGKKVVFITSWYWEGAFVLNEILERDIRIERVLIQDIWWKKFIINGYSLKYWLKYLLDRVSGLYGRRYFTLEGVCKKHKVWISYIKNINDEVGLLNEIEPDLLVVVGSRIIKENIVSKFPNKIINFHTGILPNYRGPYSEFWAMYNDDYSNIGITLHFIDTGIDTGQVIAQEHNNKNLKTPQEYHIENTIIGARLLVDTIRDFVENKVKPVIVDQSLAEYYSSPSDEQMRALEIRIGRKINIDFAE